MRLNSNFDLRAVVHSDREPWIPSPMKGVERKMLDRIGDEIARATSVVRYAPGSSFSPHTHTGGEEFLVLEGVFQDESGDFPAGTYVRNPPTSSHTPCSEKGATILVKLWQFDPHDRTQVTLDTLVQKPNASAAGVSEIPLFEDSKERVRIEIWEPNSTIVVDVHQGFEAFVLDGDFEEGGERFEKNSWLRLPVKTALEAKAGLSGARLWVKSGHLRHTSFSPEGT